MRRETSNGRKKKKKFKLVLIEVGYGGLNGGDLGMLSLKPKVGKTKTGLTIGGFVIILCFFKQQIQ